MPSLSDCLKIHFPDKEDAFVKNLIKQRAKEISGKPRVSKAAGLAAAEKVMAEHQDSSAFIEAQLQGHEPVEKPTNITDLADSLKELNSPELPLPQRIDNAVKFSDSYSMAKDALGRGFDRVKLVAQTLYNNAKTGDLGKPKEITEFDTQRDKYVGSYQISNYEAKKFGATIRKQISDPVRREAIVNYIQADGDITLLMKQHEQSLANPKTKKYAKGYEVAQNLTGDEKIFADKVNAYFESKLSQGIDAGLLETGLTDYVNQIWLKDNPIVNKLKTDIAMDRLQPNPSFIKKRIFEDYFMGEQLGYNPVAKDIGHLLTIYDQSFNKAVASRQFIRSLSDMTATDGRPTVGVSGAGKKIEGKINENDAYLIKPRDTHRVTDVSDYRIIDHPALRKWKQVGLDESGNRILLQGDLIVHPEAFKDLNNMLKKSAIRENPAGRAVLKTVASLKGTLLSLSGFHQTTVGVHAVWHGVNPFSVPKLDLSVPFQRAIVERGLIIADYKNMELFHEGITSGGLISKIPGIGPLTQIYTDWLFTDYIPRLKMKMAEEAYRRNTRRYEGKLADDQIMSITADQANAAFGELNYAKMGRNPSFQDAMRLIFLAPDFFEARARFVAQAFRPYAGTSSILKGGIGLNEQGMAAILRGTIGLYAGARIVNAILNDGDTHPEKPFSVIIKDHEVQMRTISGDVFHLLDNPLNFAYHRLTPTLIRPLITAISRRDEFGRYLTAEDWIKDFFLSHIPIPFQGITKGQKKIWESALSSIGVSAFKYRTNFERALMEESSKFNVTTLLPDERERSKLVSRYSDKLKDAIKNGNDKDFSKVFDEINADKKLFIEDITKIMDHTKSDRVEQYMKTLPAERILSVWKKANTDEQMYYKPLLAQRLTNLMHEHPERFEQISSQVNKFLEGK